jgi:hypothetical protein
MLIWQSPEKVGILNRGAAHLIDPSRWKQFLTCPYALAQISQPASQAPLNPCPALQERTSAIPWLARLALLCPGLTDSAREALEMIRRNVETEKQKAKTLTEQYYF